MVHIRLEHVDLDFRVRAGPIGLKEFLARKYFRNRGALWRTIHALRDVTLEVRRGERIGILGANGAGKSSLLKLISGVYEPLRGSRYVQGRISSLFDLRLGFEMDASGWENVRYRAFLQGATPAMLKRIRQEIAEFSELGDFLDLPLRTYSAGMIVRLGFAIATSIEPEILLVDEVLAAGDRAFAAKARARIRSLIDQASIVVLVSHDLAALSQLVDRAVWLDGGRIRLQGPVDDVVAAYCGHQTAVPGAAA